MQRYKITLSFNDLTEYQVLIQQINQLQGYITGLKSTNHLPKNSFKMYETFVKDLNDWENNNKKGQSN